MAVGYDGSIRIDTKGDATGFNNLTKQIGGGLSGITKSLKGVAAAAGIAFGAAAIVNFSKASVKAASELTNALTGLRSVMEGQGRSFQQAQKFVNDYVSDGLIPATQAITAYKNLALRGYDDSQIRKVLIALKDSAAFGRQASYSMGEAVVSASEGLKNENSILVDNAGVTKNVAKMWDEYAKSIGTTANNLTQQQKIQAEVNGILEESKYQTGDAAKVANSYSGEILKLGFNFNNLKIAVGNALIPIARAVLPSINAMITGLTRLANVFAQVTTLIFGKQAQSQERIASSGTAAVKAETGLAKATEKVGSASKKTNKELNNTLANFDELNVIAKDVTDGTDGVADALADAGGIDVSGVNTGGELFGDVEISPRIRKFIDDMNEKMKVVSPYVDRVKEAWDNLKQAFIEFMDTPAVRSIIEYFKNLLSQLLINRWAAALAAWAGIFDIASGALETLGGFLEFVAGILTGDWARAWDGWNKAGYGILQMLKGLGEIIEGVFIMLLGRDAVEAIKTFVSEWAYRISAWWTDDVAPWFSREKWLQLWADTKQWWSDGWTEIKTWWSTAVSDWWKTQVTPWFTKAKWIEVMKGVKEGFAETFKNAVNLAIELFNRLIDWVNSRMRFEWDEIKIAGKTIVPAGSVQLFNIPSIPRLATGAVIPPNAEFMAILGDQKHGRNLEAPEGLIRQIIQEELSGLGGGETTIRFEGSMGQLIRVMKPHIDKENNRRGKNLVKGAPAW